MNNKKYFNVLSLFDGISCGRNALTQVMPPDMNLRYYASEIDLKSILIAQHNYPDTIQLGDVRHITKDMFKHPIHMIMAGSPCQDFSIAGKRKGMVTVENIEILTLSQYLHLKEQEFEFIGQSYLFWEVVRLVTELNPDYFLLENVGRMSQRWIDVISDTLGVKPLRINSSRVSAQYRDRLYWTDIPDVTIPEDKGIVIADVIPDAISGYGGRGNPDGRGTFKNFKWTERKDNKANCLTTGDSTAHITLKNGGCRPLTITEREKLQTLPIGYTNVPGVTETNRKHAIGNAWTVEVIKHILAPIFAQEKIGKPVP